MEIVVLGREDVMKVIDLEQVITNVRDIYKLKANGQTVVWPLVSYDFERQNAVMDIRSGYVMGKELHGLKLLNTFPHNVEKNLPAFNGLLMVLDSNTGIPLGVMDAAYVTCMRTGAAGALGAQALARPDSQTLMLLGAGKQSAYQIAATLMLMPQLKKVIITDPLTFAGAQKFACDMPQRLKEEFRIFNREYVQFVAEEDLSKAVGMADVIITVTPSKKPTIQKEWVKSGTHFSCIGADMPGKEEIDPELFRGARIYADDKAQCLNVGEMEIPYRTGVITADDVIGELGELLTGKIAGRQSRDDITIFDATGLALLDLMAGKTVLDEAKKRNIGVTVNV